MGANNKRYFCPSGEYNAILVVRSVTTCQNNFNYYVTIPTYITITYATKTVILILIYASQPLNFQREN